MKRLWVLLVVLGLTVVFAWASRSWVDDAMLDIPSLSFAEFKAQVNDNPNHILVVMFAKDKTCVACQQAAGKIFLPIVNAYKADKEVSSYIVFFPNLPQPDYGIVCQGKIKRFQATGLALNNLAKQREAEWVNEEVENCKKILHSTR